MEHYIDKFPNEASIGQRQRVALVRALMLNPKYIFMDEITSALDVEQTSKILTKLTHLKERGIGIFIITHELGFVRTKHFPICFPILVGCTHFFTKVDDGWRKIGGLKALI